MDRVRFQVRVSVGAAKYGGWCRWTVVTSVKP